MKLVPLALACLLFTVPDLALAGADLRGEPSSAVCAKKKRRVKKKGKVERRRAAVSALTIKRWQKQGLSDESIVSRAEAAGYVADAREAKRLKKQRVRPALIAALSGQETAGLANAPPAGRGSSVEPSAVDFDAVPPPEGEAPSHGSAPRSEEKSPDSSLRPSAPFASNTAGSEAASRTSSGRVVYRASE